MSNKKKLLVTGSTFPRWEGDTEPRFVLDMASALTEYYDVTVLVPAAPNAKDEELMEGVRVKRYHYFPIHRLETLCYPGAIVPRVREKKSRALLIPFLFVSLWFHLIKECKDVDLVHAHWLIPQGIVQSFINKPYVVTGHGGDVTSLNSGIIKILKKRCLNRASKVTVVSQYLESCVKEIADIDDVEIISMGCQVSHFGPQFRVENKFSQDGKKVVLFVGRLAEKKGVKFLIEAMQGIDAKLVIVGKGPLKTELEEQAHALSIDADFIGAKTHEELKEIYASADVFVAPSVKGKDGDMEGLGLVNLEAMSSGLVVIGSRSGGIVEIVEDGVTGLLVDEKNSQQIHDAINRVLGDAELANTLRQNALDYVKQYDYPFLARRYHECFEKCLQADVSLIDS